MRVLSRLFHRWFRTPCLSDHSHGLVVDFKVAHGEVCKVLKGIGGYLSTFQSYSLAEGGEAMI
jgi:hypothetical protein